MFDLVQGKKSYLDPLVVCVRTPFWGIRAFTTKESYETYATQEEILVFLHVHTVNDGISLYGFSTEIERTFFQLLIRVSGIGPKLAIRALAHLPYQEICAGILNNESQKLASLPGIGAKTAQKIILELQDKVRNLPIDPAASQESQIFSEAFMALENFGFEGAKIQAAMKFLQKEKQNWDLPDLIRASLRLLNKK